MTLSVHTVFILRENIFFIEEWIDYHISIGFGKFFLYDNSKSIGYGGSLKGTNKYNINFGELSRHYSEDYLKDFIKKLSVKYKGKVNFIDWNQSDELGNVTYRQLDALKDYLHKYGHQSDWTAFIDMDEFIYCKYPLKSIIKAYENSDVGDIVLLQKKFDDRFNNLNIPVTSIISCINGIDTLKWGCKHILKNIYFDFEMENKYYTIHHLPTKPDCSFSIADPLIFRFNHYNVNSLLLEWMKLFYNTNIDFSLNSKCYDLFNSLKK